MLLKGIAQDKRTTQEKLYTHQLTHFATFTSPIYLWVKNLSPTLENIDLSALQVKRG